MSTLSIPPRPASVIRETLAAHPSPPREVLFCAGALRGANLAHAGCLNADAAPFASGPLMSRNTPPLRPVLAYPGLYVAVALCLGAAWFIHALVGA